MRPVEVQAAIDKLWKELPVGLGEPFNTVLKELERHERIARTSSR